MVLLFLAAYAAVGLVVAGYTAAKAVTVSRVDTVLLGLVVGLLWLPWFIADPPLPLVRGWRRLKRWLNSRRQWPVGPPEVYVYVPPRQNQTAN